MACFEPIKTLVKNGGFDQTIVSQLCEKHQDENYIGFNLRTAKIENLIESGIFDALNVVTSTLIDAVSVSSMILTTECVIANSKIYIRKFISFANFSTKTSNILEGNVLTSVVTARIVIIHLICPANYNSICKKLFNL